jgi:tetratricopeptide (TPR) repeat protein
MNPSPLLGVVIGKPLCGQKIVTDWFRNTTWNKEVEEMFEEKLRRARRKEQYLRIQACTLARSQPEVALRLLDRYFRMPDDFDHAQAHVDRADALLALNRVPEAIESYEAALARESAFPNLQTQAYLDLPYVIATRGLRDHYGRAVELLLTSEARLMFPVDRFRWYTARTLIAAAEGDHQLARTNANRALEAASVDNSGFRYHASVGLVTGKYDDVIRKLEEYRTA